MYLFIFMWYYFITVIREKYNRPPEYLRQNVGEVGYAIFQYIPQAKNYIVHMVTKDKYFDKPTYLTIYNALFDVRRKCITKEVKYLVMPRIACGCDGKDYRFNYIRKMIQYIFEGTLINIIVCM